ncbi:MAG: hypothetical protein WDO74_13795 [Pseudomonadota bacterium]
MFREASSLAETSGQTERMKTARERAARLEPRLAWLTIEVARDALVPGLQIRRNSVLVSPDLAGTPTPVDPGEVVVEASAPKHLPFSTKVTVATKGRAVVSIPPLTAAPDAAPVPAAVVVAQDSAAPVPANPAPPADPPPRQLASAAQLRREKIAPALGSWWRRCRRAGCRHRLRAQAMSNADDAREICPKGVCNEEQGATAASDAHNQARISNISFAIGAVAVATGVVLYFALPTKQATQVGLLPTFDQSSLGLVLRGTLEL